MSGTFLNYVSSNPARVWQPVDAAGTGNWVGVSHRMDRFVDANRFVPDENLSSMWVNNSRYWGGGHWFPPRSVKYYALGLVGEYDGHQALGLSHFIWGSHKSLFLNMRNLFGHHIQRILWGGQLTFHGNKIVEYNDRSEKMQRWQEMLASGETQTIDTFNTAGGGQSLDSFDIPEMPEHPRFIVENAGRLPFGISDKVRVTPDHARHVVPALRRIDINRHDLNKCYLVTFPLGQIINLSDDVGRCENPIFYESNSRSRDDYLTFARLIEQVGIPGVSQTDLAITKKVIRDYRWDIGYASVDVDRDKLIPAIQRVIDGIKRFYAVDELFLLPAAA